MNFNSIYEAFMDKKRFPIVSVSKSIYK